MKLAQLVDVWGSDNFVINDKIRLFHNGAEFFEVRNDWFDDASPLRKYNPVTLGGIPCGTWGDLLNEEITDMNLYQGELLISIDE